MTKKKSTKKAEIKKAPEAKKEEPKAKTLTKEEKAEIKKLEGEIKVLAKEERELQKQNDVLAEKIMLMEDDGPSYEAEEQIKRDIKEFPKTCKRMGVSPDKYLKACNLYLAANKEMWGVFDKEKTKVEAEQAKLEKKMEDLSNRMDEKRARIRELKPEPPRPFHSTFTF